MYFRSVDYQLTHLVYVIRRDWLGIGEFLGENWWYPDLVGLDVDIRGDDGSSCIVDSFPLNTVSMPYRSLH
jgi:hypothetical protein